MVQVSKSMIKSALCEYAQPWRGRYLPVYSLVQLGDVRVLLDDLCAGAVRLGLADDPLPDDVVRKLDLFEGATFAHAMALLLWAYDQPVEHAPEEHAEEELSVSEAFAAFNEMTGGDPSVMYPKGSSTRH
jgi:hypothetical protein